MVDLTGPGAGPGTYNVSITFGDREEIQESLHVLINGYQADRVSTMPGDFLTRTYQVNVHRTAASIIVPRRRRKQRILFHQWADD